MELLIGNVTAKGTKNDVLDMFDALEDYYDKCLLEQSGTDEKYKIEFEFASKITSFMSYEYFESYSENFQCYIKATLNVEGMEDEEEPMVLEYKNGEIIHGLSEYGLDG